MVTSVALRNVTWFDGVQVAAQDLRLQSTAAHLTAASPLGATGIAARPGVRFAPGNPLLVSASSGMNISVAAGFAFVQGTASATAGMYEGCLDTTSTLTVTTSDPTNPRIDNVIVRFIDNGNNTSTGTVEITAGTPAASPVAPALPANSLLLATIAVGASVSSITAGNITDARVYTVATGGTLPMANTSGGITGPPGLYAHDLSNGRLKVSDGSGNARSPKVAAFAPAATSSPAFFDVTSTSYQAVISTSVTVDGATEIEATFTWQRIIQETGSPSINDVIVAAFSTTSGGGGTYTWPGTIDGGFNIYSNGSSFWSGGMWRGWITPAAGTVTIYVLASLGGTSHYRISGPGLRVQASTAL